MGQSCLRGGQLGRLSSCHDDTQLLFHVRYVPMERVQVFFHLAESVGIGFFWGLGRLVWTHGAYLHLLYTTPSRGGLLLHATTGAGNAQ